MRGVEVRTSLKVMVLAVVFTTLACSDEDEPVMDERVDEGALSFRQSGSNGLEVRVTVDACYSGSCSDFESASCYVERKAEVLEIASNSRVKVWGGICTDDCQMHGSSCTLEDLPAGEYRIVHGDFECTLTLPPPEGKWLFASSACDK